jgi:predicted AlkP superfamily pyrophosphatase or phosphodiesterase
MKNGIRLIALLAAAVGVGAHAQPRPIPPKPARYLTSGWNAPQQQAKPYVVLVSFDGFRADYPDLFEAPNFRRVANNGVRADGLLSIFPSKTFPNHLSIVTGLRAEAHGIVSNSFFDPHREQGYSMSDAKTVTDGTWYLGEPFWVTAERQGMVTGTYFWPGSEAAIKGIRPSYWTTYDGKVPNASRVDTVLGWLQFPPERRPHFVTLYFSDVDTAGHEAGPATGAVGRAIEAVDRQLGRLLDGIDKLEIRDQVYIILVSDHGMSETGPGQYTSIESLIDPSRVVVNDAGSVASLRVVAGPREAPRVRDDINAKLEHGRAYLRADVPPKFHYNRSSRIGDVIVIMEEHYQIGRADRIPKGPIGAHGWDPALKSMNGIFFVMGPGIRKGARIPLVSNLDIYPFMGDLLRVQPAPRIDGHRGILSSLCVEGRRRQGRARVAGAR